MTSERRILQASRAIMLVLVLALLTRVAWISDDALITLRTALNLSEGWGPGFNAMESVQAFTHPLWFLLWLIVGSTTNQWLTGIILLSLIFAGLSIFLLFRLVRSVPRLIAITVLLLLSSSFVDYTTSGLENPLAFLSIAIIFSCSLSLAHDTSRPMRLQLVALGSASSALLLTRLDLVVLILVPVAYVSWTRRQKATELVPLLIALLSPLILWFLWSFSNYASFLPNTFVAKTNASIPREELIFNGLRYVWISFIHDPIAFLVIVLALTLALFLGWRIHQVWSLGFFLYLLYIVWIGGDFMAGRFISVPFFVALLILASLPEPSLPTNVQLGKYATVNSSIVLALLLISTTYLFGARPTALLDPQSMRWSANDWAGIADERGEYVERGRTLSDLLILGGDVKRGEFFRAINNSIQNWPRPTTEFNRPDHVIVSCGQLGILGLEVGPRTHIIDQCALTDRFLADMEYIPESRLSWRPGHLSRSLPDGYVEAVRLSDPAQVLDNSERARLIQTWEKIRDKKPS